MTKYFLNPTTSSARHLAVILTLMGMLAICVSCKNNKENEMPSALGITDKAMTDEYDLNEIQQSGDLIMLTLYGPDTYYEYHGKGLGLQYELAAAFAKSLGVQLRVEVARDTVDLLKKLNNNEADLIGMELPVTDSLKKKFLYCGACTDSVKKDSTPYNKTAWLVRKNSPLLAEAADDWYTSDLKNKIRLADIERFKPKRRSARTAAPILNLKGGIISRYDDLFIRHSQRIGWDWRLMAAQCYQESTFDPMAVSWAGASGLMQIMPGTAAHLGLSMSQIHDPNANVEAAAKYLDELMRHFSDIRDRNERISFVLASYNGGYFHIRDAMALAQKYNKNPHSWNDVSEYVLHLKEPAFYNDAVVKHGYMRGTETYDYVRSIRSRWEQYREKIRSTSTRPAITMPEPHKGKTK